MIPSMKRTVALLFGVVAGACLVSACATPQPTPASAPAVAPGADGTVTPPLTLLIDNQSFYDANVYVLVGNAKVRRLGTVEGKTKRQFALVGPQFAPGQAIALYAKTIAEGQEYKSGVFSVYADIGMRWTLESRGVEWLISMSHASE